MFFFQWKKNKVYPTASKKKEKDPPNTKGKIFFKNLRLRCKLHNNEKLETPEAIHEKVEHCSRFRKFINFFKFGRSKFSFLMSRRKKSRTIGPMKTNLSIGCIDESCNNDSSEIIHEVSCNGNIGQIFIENTFKRNIENTSAGAYEASCESGQVIYKKGGEIINVKAGEDLFNELDVKIAESDKKNKLAPIQGARLKNVKLESEIYHNPFYSANFRTEDNVTESRPSTAKLLKKPYLPSNALTKEVLKLRQIRANELRSQATDKRIELINARRDRFEKNKTIMDEAKQQKIKNSRDARKKRRDQAYFNKSRINAQRIERSKSRVERWTDRYQGQLIAEEEKHNHNVLKVERKRNATNLVCEKRDNKIRQKTEFLHAKHVNISVRLELDRASFLSRPRTAPADAAFRSRQPSNEDEPLC